MYMYICIYMYTYIYIYLYICTYTYVSYLYLSIYLSCVGGLDSERSLKIACSADDHHHTCYRHHYESRHATRVLHPYRLLLFKCHHFGIAFVWGVWAVLIPSAC